MMKARPTIIDVAKEAGVSKSTVSLVLQNSPKVKAKTRDLVMETITALGYVYNRSAAQLRSAKTGLVGIAINELRNPYFTELAASLQMEFSKYNYATVIANIDENPELQNQIIRAMIEHGVSGLVISPVPSSDLSAFESLKKHGIPTLQATRKILDDYENFPFAAPDNYKGGRLVAEHLLEKGAKSIAYIGGKSNVSATQERLKGYLDVMAERQMKPIVFEGQTCREFGHKMAHILAQDYPEIDGVACFNDLIAFGMISGCARLGREIGPQFRIVGFDDTTECAEIYPSLSSIHCGIGDFGRMIANIMLDWIENGAQPPLKTRTDVSLIMRETSQ